MRTHTVESAARQLGCTVQQVERMVKDKTLITNRDGTINDGEISHYLNYRAACERGARGRWR